MARFQPGRSPNPGGRPRINADLRNAARAHTAEALATLVKIMSDERASSAARVTAATAVLDRGWGRPHQAVIATTTSRSLNELSDEQLLRIARGEPANDESPAGPDEPVH